MLDKKSREYKQVMKLYKDGKISEEDLARLLDALDHYEECEENPESATPEEKKSFAQVLKDFGIKLKEGYESANKAAEEASDKLRGIVMQAMHKFADSLGDEGGEAAAEGIVVEEVPKRADIRTPEDYGGSFEEMYIKVSYIGKKNFEIMSRTKKLKPLFAKCKKLMTSEGYGVVDGVVADKFIGRSEYSSDGEYVRITVRPKKFQH